RSGQGMKTPTIPSVQRGEAFLPSDVSGHDHGEFVWMWISRWNRRPTRTSIPRALTRGPAWIRSPIPARTRVWTPAGMPAGTRAPGRLPRTVPARTRAETRTTVRGRLRIPVRTRAPGRIPETVPARTRVLGRTRVPARTRVLALAPDRTGTRTSR